MRIVVRTLDVLANRERADLNNLYRSTLEAAAQSCKWTKSVSKLREVRWMSLWNFVYVFPNAE